MTIMRLHTFPYTNVLLTRTAFHRFKFHQQPRVLQNLPKLQHLHLLIHRKSAKNLYCTIKYRLILYAYTMKQLHAMQNMNLRTMQKVGHVGR